MNRTKAIAQRPGKRAVDPLATRMARGEGDPPITRIPLRTVEHVRVQLAKLFREAKSGKIEAGAATKLAYLLNILRQTIEVGNLEGDVERLAAQVAELQQVARATRHN